MASVTISPWVGSPPGTIINAWPLINLPFNLTNWNANKVQLSEATSGGYWPITLNDSISRFWVLFEGNSLPANEVYSALATIDLQQNAGSSSNIGTVAVPQVLEDAGFDPTNIIRYRGTTWAILFENLGGLTNATELWFTLRRRDSDSDAKSIVQISSIGGLLVSNSVPASTSANGSIVVVESTTGDVLVTLKPSETVKYPVTNNLKYDIKVKRSNGDIDLIMKSSRFVISGDVTRKII